MAIRHNSPPQSGYLFSAQHYLTNNYSVYSIKPWNPNKWPQHVRLKHYSTFYNLSLMNKKPHTRTLTHSHALMQRQWGDMVIRSLKKYIIKSEPIHLFLFFFFSFSKQRQRKVAGGADVHSKPRWEDTVFSLLKEKKGFYKVTWVYEEKVAACR